MTARGSRKTGRKRAPRARKTLAAPGNFVWNRLAAHLNTILGKTVLMKVLVTFVALWLGCALAMYLAERNVPGSAIETYGDAIYWSVAAFSTAGIADTPTSGMAQLIGAIWIIVGSVIFFGTIVATVTAYFMRPMERPVNQIVETVEYNLERLDELSVEELALLKKTSDTLILHMERLKKREDSAPPGPG